MDKVSCYVSDDGAAMLSFESLSETSEFARKWVPFCKKYQIEPRAPEWYFAQKIDYLKDKVQPSFVKDRRAMKVRIITLPDFPFTSGHTSYFFSPNYRENMKNSKFVSTLSYPRPRKFLKKVGSCKMVHHGLEIIQGITRE